MREITMSNQKMAGEWGANEIMRPRPALSLCLVLLRRLLGRLKARCSSSRDMERLSMGRWSGAHSEFCFYELHCENVMTQLAYELAICTTCHLLFLLPHAVHACCAVLVEVPIRGTLSHEVWRKHLVFVVPAWNTYAPPQSSGVPVD